MDKKTLVIIVVTAAVSTTITVTLGWVLNFTKIQIISRLIPKAQTTLGKRILEITVYIGLLANNCFSLFVRITPATPPTRYDVLWIVIATFSILVSLGLIVGFFAKIRFEKKFGKLP